ncbi:MAG TPA: hypothetical protein VK468_04110, partial [Pyrinomonadaceae bacterium]|nr:hypothetical protein [Pyrinomonadaceae bacterium]
ILLQTTIPFIEDDWHIGRFSYLHKHLESLRDENGDRLYIVAARDRETDDNGDDPVLLGLPSSDVDQLWLFAVDVGDGLSVNDCAAITKFRQLGGGIFSTRDHNDLGSSLCTLGGVGAAHYFHSKNLDPDADRNKRDDRETANIDFPNYHSGSNGDYQKIKALEPHELLKRTDGSLIQYFPAHPHEGGVGAPADNPFARVIATGTSQATGRPFNLVVAFDRCEDRHGNNVGRAIAESSFHHLVDYNWDVDSGAPSFVEEAPGDGYKKNPNALGDIHQYVVNAAKWLAKSEPTA